MSQSLKFDAVIVGGGIAGCALACALDQKNISVLLVEAGALLSPKAIDYCVSGFDPRVSALTVASEKFLAELGVWNTIAAQRVGDFNTMHVFDGEGTAEINFCAKDINESHLGHIVENSQIIYALQQRLSFSNNIKIASEVKISSLVKNETGYRLECENHPMVETPLIIGADGANSFVRKACGFKTREWDYQHHAIVCTVETMASHQKTAWQSDIKHMQVCCRNTTSKMRRRWSWLNYRDPNAVLLSLLQ